LPRVSEKEERGIHAASTWPCKQAISRLKSGVNNALGALFSSSKILEKTEDEDE
jgi:hypothetical protein